MGCRCVRTSALIPHSGHIVSLPIAHDDERCHAVVDRDHRGWIRRASRIRVCTTVQHLTKDRDQPTALHTPIPAEASASPGTALRIAAHKRRSHRSLTLRAQFAAEGDGAARVMIGPADATGPAHLGKPGAPDALDDLQP